MKLEEIIWKFLKWFCKSEYLPDIEGDLRQLFLRRIKSRGIHTARWLLLQDVIFLFRPGIIGISNPVTRYFQMSMIQSYWISAYRNTLRSKTLGLVQVLGLSIGMMAVITILIHIDYEFSFDQFHQNKDRIYRVEMDRIHKGIRMPQSANTFSAVGPELKETTPGVESFTRVFILRDLFLFVEESGVQSKAYRIPEATLVDESFLTIFSYGEVLQDALSEPNTIVLTKSMAEKLFGDVDPIGRTLTQFRGQRDTSKLLVTGVIPDPPANSHLDFEVLISYASLFQDRPFTKYSWTWSHVYTYVLLRDQVPPLGIVAQLNDVIGEQKREVIHAQNMSYEFSLRPIDDIHLSGDLQNEVGGTQNRSYLYFLNIAALLLLSITWMNAFNLAYVRNHLREKEIRIRSALGARHHQLGMQLFVESLFANVIALIIALMMVMSAAPVISAYLSIQLPIKSIFQPNIFLLLLTMVTLGSLISAMSPMQLRALVNGRKAWGLKEKTGSGAIRRTGVVLQFTLSFILMLLTVTVHAQLRFIRAFDLGIETDYSVVVRGSGLPGVAGIEASNRLFKDQLRHQTWLKSVAACNYVPGQDLPRQKGIRLKGESVEAGIEMTLLPADSNIVKTLGLKLLMGNDFSSLKSDSLNAVLLNETAAKALGYSDFNAIMGRKIVNDRGQEYTLIGIIDDYHQGSLKQVVEPMMIRHIEFAKYYFIINMNAGNITEQLATIENSWDQVYPNSPFVFFFLDQHLEHQYQSELTFGRFFTLISGIGMLIAFMGVFSLSSFYANNRTKEIGVRKVLGGSVRQMVWLLSSHIFFLTLLGTIVAVPVAYLSSSFWLENYEFSVEQHWTWYGACFVVILLISTITVSGQTYQTAKLNPARTLRSE